MGFPWLLYDDCFSSGSITASSQDAANNYFARNIGDWKPFITRWQPSNLSATEYVTVDLGSGVTKLVNTVYLIDHNLYSCSVSGCQWKIQYSSDNVSFSDAFSWQTPTSDKAQFKTFTLGFGYRYYRFIWQNIGAGNVTTFPYVGSVVLGQRLDFPMGLQPGWVPYNETTKQSAPKSNSGVFLGTSRKSIERTYQLFFPEFIPSSFFDDGTVTGITLDNFWKYHAGRGPTENGPLPFIFAWDDTQETPSWCRIQPETTYSTPYGSTYNYRGLSLVVDAYVEV